MALEDLIQTCECTDPDCRAGHGSDCLSFPTVKLARYDYADATERVMCEPCAIDALESGVFSPDGDDEDEDGESSIDLDVGFDPYVGAYTDDV